jgi:translation initiation factor eIF-2B subunit delta
MSDSNDNVTMKSNMETKKKKKKEKKKEKKQPPPGGWPKKKKLSKAERRALQEKQRAAKQASSSKGDGKGSRSVSTKNDNMSSAEVATSESNSNDENVFSGSIERMFSHLPRHIINPSSTDLNVRFGSLGVRSEKGKSPARIHPSVLRCGLRITNRQIEGSNERCVAMLEAFKDFVLDFQELKGSVFKVELDNALKVQINFLVNCRPLAFSMRNAIRWLRRTVSKTVVDDENSKSRIANSIEDYIEQKIEASSELIANFVLKKIQNGDVVMTYVYNPTIETTLLRALQKGIDFRVVVVDARPHVSKPAVQGKQLLRRLAKEGLKCTYVHLSAVSYVMQSVTKVLLGSESMLSNGVAVGYSGTATVALVARAFNKPVLFCCESYKFSEKVQLDSIVSNEQGEEKELALGESSKICAASVLNLLYDSTPSELITMVVTDVGMIPSTSVPVVIRETMSDLYG